MKGHYPSHKVLLCVIFIKVYIYIYISLYIAIYNNYTYSAGMKERCRDGCRTSLLIAGFVLVLAIFHTLLPPCHPYITTHFMEMIFPLVRLYNSLVGFYIGTNTHSAYLYLKLFETLVITKDYVTDKCIPCIHLVMNNWCVEKNGCHFVPFVSDSSTKWTRIVSVL